MPAEPHGVGERDRDLCLARAIRDVVEIALGVADLLIDRRREDALAHREEADRRFNGAGRAERVSGHRLRRRDREPRRVIAEDRLERRGLGTVIRLGRGAVRVHVADPLCWDARVLDRHAHRAHRALAARWRCRHVMRVGGLPVPDDFTKDFGAPGSCEVERLEHQATGTLAENETVALFVERPRRTLGVVVSA